LGESLGAAKAEARRRSLRLSSVGLGGGISVRDTFTPEEIAQYKTNPERFPLHMHLYTALDKMGFAKEKWPGIRGPNDARNHYAHPKVSGVSLEQVINLYISTFQPDSYRTSSLQEFVSCANRMNA